MSHFTRIYGSFKDGTFSLYNGQEISQLGSVDKVE